MKGEGKENFVKELMNKGAMDIEQGRYSSQETQLVKGEYSPRALATSTLEKNGLSFWDKSPSENSALA